MCIKTGVLDEKYLPIHTEILMGRDDFSDRSKLGGEPIAIAIGELYKAGSPIQGLLELERIL